MNKLTKQLGVTLLEVMLVLAVAAMVIVMSIRYYQSASANQQVNATIQMAQGISAAADSLAQKDGAYDNTDVTASNIQSLMPSNTMVTPWGTTAVFAPVDGNSYTVTFPTMPGTVCLQVRSRLSSNAKFDGMPACAAAGASADFSYTFNSLK